MAFPKDQQTMMKQLFVSPQFSPTNRRTFDQQLATRLFDLETGSPRAKYRAPVLETSPWYTWNWSDMRLSHAVVTKTNGENQSWNQRQKWFTPDPLSWIHSSILWWDDIERWDDAVEVKETSNKCFHFSGKNLWQSFESTCSCLIELCLICPRILVERGLSLHCLPFGSFHLSLVVCFQANQKSGEIMVMFDSLDTTVDMAVS